VQGFGPCGAEGVVGGDLLPVPHVVLRPAEPETFIVYTLIHTIYIYIEREIDTYTYTYIYNYILCIYTTLYIYIYTRYL